MVSFHGDVWMKRSVGEGVQGVALGAPLDSGSRKCATPLDLPIRSGQCRQRPLNEILNRVVE